jgi:hypothetical protein
MPKDTSQLMADIQQCWKGTGYHTSFAGRAQRPFSHSVTSRFALFRAILLLFKTNGDRARMQRGENWSGNQCPTRARRAKMRQPASASDGCSATGTPKSVPDSPEWGYQVYT